MERVQKEPSPKIKEMLGDWQVLYPFFISEEWEKIKNQLKPDMSQITPEVSNWFKAFKLCPYKDIKMVWLGLSPYYTKDNYTKENVADGLAFSTDQKHSVPPSLFKIYKGIEGDLWNRMNLDMSRSNDLSFLAKQGVLLLNSALTTTYGKADSHLIIWEPFIKYVLNVLSKKEVIFCGFGRHACEQLSSLDKKEIVFEREHPAASAYNYREWHHENLFSAINEKLSKQNKEIILWDKYLTELQAPF